MINYRPISVISVVAKVFEIQKTYDQVYAYLSEHNIILKSQSGYSLYPFYGHCSSRVDR